MRKNIKPFKYKNFFSSAMATILTFSMVIQPLAYAIEPFADVPKSHWILPTLTMFLEDEIIEPADTFNLGKGVTQYDVYTLLKKIKPDLFTGITNTKTYDKTQHLSRIQALKLIFSELQLEGFALQMSELKSPYKDTTSDAAILNLAVQFGWIGVGVSEQFRPTAIMKKEELYSVLGKIHTTYQSDFDMLHGYYAISSYSQIQYAPSFDSLSFGWSRLELSKDLKSVVINTTSANNNEYYMPSGSKIVLDQLNPEEQSKQLMVFVKDESVYDATLGKTVSMAEFVLSHETFADQAIEGIMDTLSKNTYYEGVLIDFEGLKGDQNASHLNDFLSKIDKKLEQSGLSLYVAVHPVRKTGLAYYDGYDYKTIGEYADYVVLMAHDYYAKKLSTSDMNLGYTVTPLTPINEIYIALSAITDKNTGVTDKDKVLLQLSFDSVQWKLKEGNITNALPYHPTYAAIASRIDSGVVSKYSTALQSPYLEFIDAKDGTSNVVWYENEKSVQAKIDMAKMFGIGGISLWRLGTIPNVDIDGQSELKIWDTILKNIDERSSES